MRNAGHLPGDRSHRGWCHPLTATLPPSLPNPHRCHQSLCVCMHTYVHRTMLSEGPGPPNCFSQPSRRWAWLQQLNPFSPRRPAQKFPYLWNGENRVSLGRGVGGLSTRKNTQGAPSFASPLLPTRTLSTSPDWPPRCMLGLITPSRPPSWMGSLQPSPTRQPGPASHRDGRAGHAPAVAPRLAQSPRSSTLTPALRPPGTAPRA